ncbi:MAG: hypothetical protein JNK72_25810 [Myxococcales bacterium]|nr:hypothetical protein [Myxococcales bacterium]
MLVVAVLAGCGEATLSPAITPPPPRCVDTTALDVLFVIDNSSRSSAMQQHFLNALPSLFEALQNPPPHADGTPGTPVTDLHLGVISTNIGTGPYPTSDCSVMDGDNGLLNPIRQGNATRRYLPWNQLRPGVRPSLCTNDRFQFPPFLTDTSYRSTVADEVRCMAYLGVFGCGLEQPLEATYRALRVHDPGMRRDANDPNFGFLRPDASLLIVVVTDDDDASIRDCRFAEAGHPCDDATSVSDLFSTRWPRQSLPERVYFYTPGGEDDPTWPIDRYVDRSNPSRGFLGLKPGHPERVAVAVWGGVPNTLPRTANGRTDWNTLLGRASDGHDAYQALSPEGPVSMRPSDGDLDCRSLPAHGCREEGTPYRAICLDAQQRYAFRAYRLASVARALDEGWGTGMVTSICKSDLSASLREAAALTRCRAPR